MRQTITAFVVLTLACSAVAQTPAASDLNERVLTILKASPRPDAKLIEAVEKIRATKAPASQPSSLALVPLFASSTTDAATLLKLFPLHSGSDTPELAAALIEGAKKQAEIEVTDPANVEPLLTAIAQIQPAMNKFAWRNSDSLKPYGELLAVFVDNCPPDKPQLANKLADIQIRQITAARFSLPPEQAIARMQAIDPTKLSRDKDVDQLDYLLMEQLRRANRPADAVPHARAVWNRRGSQFRQMAWPILVDGLLAEGKKAEAAALMDEVEKTMPKNLVGIPEYRARVNAAPTTQPAN